MSERGEAARKNRQAMPKMTRFVDEMRAVFGPGVKVLWARENGLEVGVPGPAGTPLTPPQAKPNDRGRG